MTDSTSPRFGDIMQNGYVVDDLETAAMHWVNTLGVGPFFFMEHIEFSESFYRGKPAEIDMSVAIAYSGNLQIELVQQHNDAPSIYKTFRDQHGQGLQHVGALVDNLDTCLSTNNAESLKLQWGTTGAGQRFAYLATDFHNGAMIELIEADESMHNAFTSMQRTASEWDGSHPLRGRQSN